MMNLHPHNRFHISNGLAMFAALLLLISSVVGYEASQEKVREAGLGQVYTSGQEIISSVKGDSAENDSINDTAEHKRRGLKLGLLLFRRG